MTQTAGSPIMLDPGSDHLPGSSGHRSPPKAGTPATRAPLAGQRVAFAGRFASLTRSDAQSLVTRAGGRVTSLVTSHPTILVVGMRGWPLMDSGRIPKKLADAERLRAAGKPIRILSETAFRELIGLQAPGRQTVKSLSGPQVCQALGIDARVLQRWEHCGLVRSHDDQYDFRDLVSLRTVTGLVARGVSPVIIRKSLDALGAFLPGVDRPLAQLNILVTDSGELVAELEEALLTQSGQLEFRFDLRDDQADQPDQAGHNDNADQPDRADARHDPHSRPSVSRRHAPQPLALVPADTRDSAAWIEAGLRHEDAGELDKAEHAYRRAAALAPSDPAPQFNLGNVLLAGGRLEAAAERYAQATALDPSHAQAWFNLAHVQDTLKDRHSALKYLRKAIAADPAYADAHYNLGDLAERLGDRATAIAAWDGYLKLDPASEWSAEARRRLQTLRQTPRSQGGPAWA